MIRLVSAVLFMSVIQAVSATPSGFPSREEQSFQGKTLSRNFEQRLIAPPRLVFPLMSPVGEKKWAFGWDPEFVSCRDGCDKEGAVFRTRDGEEQSIWYLREWDTVRWNAEYIIFTGGNRLTVLRFELREDGTKGSRASIRYRWTALSPDGNRFIEKHSGPAFEHYMTLWERALNHYLRTGRILADGRELAEPHQIKADKK